MSRVRTPVEELELFLFSEPGVPLELFIFTFRYELDGDQWTGECVELGTATYDTDRDTVHDELSELVLHALNALEKDNEREAFFKKHGIEAVQALRHLRDLTLRGLNFPGEATTAQAAFWAPSHGTELAAAAI